MSPPPTPSSSSVSHPRSTSTHRAPPRNKSSTSLHTSHSSSRPKRTKSSSSLAGSVHHASGGKKGVLHKRSGSSGRRAAVEFGLTSLAPLTSNSHVNAKEVSQEEVLTDEEEDEEDEVAVEQGERERRPVNRRNSSSSIATVKDLKRQERDRILRQQEEVHRAPAQVQTRVRSSERAHAEGLEGGRGRKSGRTKVLSGENEASYQSGSDWESATDSPLKLEKRTNTETSSERSGLSGIGGTRLPIIGNGNERIRPEVSPTRKNGRAKFQLGSDDAYSPMSVSINNKLPPPPPLSPVAQVTKPLPERFISTHVPTVVEHYPAPIPSTSKLPPPPLLKTKLSIPFPSAVPVPATPLSPTSPRRPRNPRVSSSTSLMSITSTRSLAASFGGLMGPSRIRRVSGITPTLDRETVARAELIGTEDGSNSASIARKRFDSLASLRSLAEVAGTGGRPAPSRSSTMGPSEGRDLARRMRLAQGSASDGGAIAALGNIRERARTPSASSETSTFTQAKRTASGYFASLRGFTSLPSLTPPSPSSTSSSATPLSNNGRFYSGLNADGSSTMTSSAANYTTGQGRKGKGRLLNPNAHIVISRFLDTPSSSPLVLPTPLPQTDPTFSSQAQPPPTKPTAQSEGMQKWAQALVREAERIERQYRAVDKWRDPLGESLERVLKRELEEKESLNAGVKGGREGGKEGGRRLTRGESAKRG